MELTKTIRQTSGWLSVALVFCALVIIVYSSAFAQTAKRVNFPEGEAEVVFNDSAKIGEKDVYVIKLKKGQNCQVDVEWRGEDLKDEGQGLSGLTIVDPNGVKSENVQDGLIQPGETGDYRIEISPPYEKTDYRYRLTFTDHSRH